MRGDRAARAHGRAGLLRRRPTGTRSPRWSSTSTSRCSATATSGRPPTRSGWSSRPAPPAWSSAAAAWAGPWLFRDLAAAFAGEQVADAARRSARCAAMMRRHAELLCRAHGGGAGLQGVPQARLVVPQGLRGRRRRCAARWPWSTRWPSSTCCWPSSTRPSRSRSPSWARRAAARARRATRSPCPRAGSTTPTAPATARTEETQRDHRRVTRLRPCAWLTGS